MSIRLPAEIPVGEDRLIVDAEGHDIAEASYVEYAEFIVRACNSHDDLLATLEAIAAGEPCSDSECLHDEFACAAKQAQEAVAKATRVGG